MNPSSIHWHNPNNSTPHPYVIVELKGDIATICRITSNKKKIGLPGNVVLEAGEGNLEKESIVDVSDVLEVNTKDLGEFIGNLNQKRVTEILAGIKFLKKSYF